MLKWQKVLKKGRELFLFSLDDNKYVYKVIIKIRGIKFNLVESLLSFFSSMGQDTQWDRTLNGFLKLLDTIFNI